MEKGLTSSARICRLSNARRKKRERPMLVV